MDEPATLPFGPLDGRALHVCVDMQRIFLEPGPWFGEACRTVIGPIQRLLAHAPAQLLFTRFITASQPADATGCWQRYYRHWQAVTQDVAGAARLEVCDELSPWAKPENTYDKRGYDAFKSAAFCARVAQQDPSALIISGIETEACVLATAMSAVDLGYRTIIPTDGVASSNPASHAATLWHVLSRLDLQVELAAVDTIIGSWGRA